MRNFNRLARSPEAVRPSYISAPTPDPVPPFHQPRFTSNQTIPEDQLIVRAFCDIPHHANGVTEIGTLITRSNMSPQQAAIHLDLHVEAHHNGTNNPGEVVVYWNPDSPATKKINEAAKYRLQQEAEGWRKRAAPPETYTPVKTHSSLHPKGAIGILERQTQPSKKRR